MTDTDPRRLDLKRQSTEEQSSVSGLMKPTYMRNLYGSLDRRVSALSKSSQYAFSNKGRLQTKITDQSFHKNDSKSIFRRKQSLLNQNRRILSPKKIAIGLKTSDQNKKRIDSGQVSTKNLASMNHANLSSPFRPHMLAINHASDRERPHVHPLHSKSQQIRYKGVSGVRYQPQNQFEQYALFPQQSLAQTTRHFKTHQLLTPSSSMIKQDFKKDLKKVASKAQSRKGIKTTRESSVIQE